MYHPITLLQVHIFLELKHSPEEPEDASNLIDGCLLTHPSGSCTTAPTFWARSCSTTTSTTPQFESSALSSCA